MIVSNKIYKDLLRLWHQLSKKRKQHFIIVMNLTVLSAFMEVISLGAVLPFIMILSAPDTILSYSLVSDIANILKITSPNSLKLSITLIFVVITILATLLRIFLLWIGTRLALSCGSDLSSEIYRRILYQPYHLHLSQNSSELIVGITQKIDNVAFGVLQPVTTIISSSIMLIAITGFLIFLNPTIACVSISFLGATYALIAFLVRQRLRSNSKIVAKEQVQVVKALQEGLGGIRDVLIDGAQPTYCEIYRRADHPLRLAQSNTQFINVCPRYLMEVLGIVLIAIVAYLLSQHEDGMKSALPILSALVLGAQRLLPALQQIYSGWVSIIGQYTSLIEVLSILEQPAPIDDSSKLIKPLKFKKNILFDKVSFRYSAMSALVLDSLSFEIPQGKCIGFVGTTGSGKTTMMDLMMGLLEPNEGEIKVDGMPIKSIYLRAWQRNIAHVPQSIYLSDSSILENIAFGVSVDEIDISRVKKAASEAKISEFIESLSGNYNTFVGERGIRLSGGQRQRIGIARALYKQANVLVFDEATSALDNSTEQGVMDSIYNFGADLTILIIAHRITTVMNCDIIFELDKGKIVAQGTYEELLIKSPSFKKMANAVSRINK